MLTKLRYFYVVLLICGEKLHVPILLWAQWESKRKEEFLPVFLVSFSGQLYTENPLSGQLVLCSELSCGHSGLSAATSSPLLWCF